MQTNPLPKASSNLNGRCEKFIGTIKREALSKFILFGWRHLDYLVAEFVDYDNLHRSHMSRDHLPPIREEPEEVIKPSIDEVTVKTFVGGLIKGLERKAACRHAMAAGTLVSEHTPIIETLRCRDFQRWAIGD